MSNPYLPEGRLLHTIRNRSACAGLSGLRQAAETETVLEGRAVLCTPTHDLVVHAGDFTGVVPRNEAALGIREGTVREIAILSRVGKPVAFTVLGLDDEGDRPRLLFSRRRAQELARNALLACPPGTVIPATVTHLERFGAFVDVGCGVISMIGIENCSVSRISHPACRFTVGQEIFALITGTDPETGRIFLSHKELLGTWEENAAAFSPGMTVPGIVRSIQPYGAFVELRPNLTGLADQTEGLKENEPVSVFIKSIQPERMKIKLSIIHRLAPEETPEPPAYYITSGRLLRWDYAPAACPRKGNSRDFL